MNIIVAGGRDFNDYDLLSKTLSRNFATVKNPVIVCGEAKGADLLGKRYAIEMNLPVISKPAEWNKYGRSAGYRRNNEMAMIADSLIAFWNGKSKGTQHMIETMKRLGKQVLVVPY